MPNYIAAKLVEIGVNVVIAELIAIVAVNYALSRVSRLLTGKPRQFTPDTTQTVTITDSVAPRMIIYGQVRTSGVLIFYGVGIANASRLWFTVTIAGHQCDDMTDVWLDNVRVADSDIDGDSLVTGGAYADAAYLYRMLGTSAQTAITQQVNEIDGWGTNSRGMGIAYLSARFTSDSTRDATVEPVFPDGAPRDFFVMVKGRRVYDPRLDSTNGGSGSHRLTDPSTWAWSNNPALCIADYITGGSQWYDTSSITQRLGMNESTSRIDWPNWAAQADICDQTPAIPPITTQKRYTCSGVLSCGETHSENLAKLLSSCAGQLVYRGGKYRLYVGAYASPSHTITDADLTGPYQVFPNKKRAELYNAVSGVFIDPAQNYQPMPCPLRTDEDYEDEDGGRIFRSIDLPMTNDTFTAQRLCELAKRQSRNQITGFVTLGLNGFKIATMETFNLALVEEWVGNKVVRCTDWKLIPENPPKCLITFAEESSSAYGDLDTGDYGSESTTTPEPNSSETPTVPSNPRTTSQPNAILVAWDPSPTRGVLYVVYESTSVSMTSPVEVYRGADTQVVLPKSVTTNFFYNLRAYNGKYSGYLPSTNGFSGKALVSDTTFTASLSTGSLYRRVTTSSGTTSFVTATASLGTAPYTYAWAYVSGDSSISANSASSATTSFTRTGMVLHNSYTAVWRMTITDNTSATATADITVTIERENDV